MPLRRPKRQREGNKEGRRAGKTEPWISDFAFFLILQMLCLVSFLGCV